MGAVSHELDYGMDLANFILGKHSLDLLHIGCEAKAASMGVPLNGTGQEVPVQVGWELLLHWRCQLGERCFH